MISNNTRGGVAMVAAMGAFVASDSFLKLAFGRLPALELLALRTSFSAVLCLGLIFALGQARQLPSVVHPWAIARGVCEVAATLCYLLAVFHMPISDVASIVLTSPLLIIVGAALLYGTKIDALRLGLILLGLVGALLVAQPGSSAASPYAILAFGAAVVGAVRDLIAPKVPGEIPTFVVTLTVLLCICLTTGIGTMVFEQPLMPNGRELAMAAMAGLLGIVGQACMFFAYRIGAPQRIAPFMYSLMIWAIVLGYVFAGNVPNVLALCGMAIIAAAGLVLIRADSKKAAAA